MTTVKMDTLWSRFYADISATGGNINMGSSGECLESQFHLSSSKHIDIRELSFFTGSGGPSVCGGGGPEF